MTLIETTSPEAVPGLDLNRPGSNANLSADAMVLFEEMKRIAVGFMQRTQAVEGQLNSIVAMFYVNTKRRAEDGDLWSIEMIKFLDLEIAKLKDLGDRYFVEFAKAKT